MEKWIQLACTEVFHPTSSVLDTFIMIIVHTTHDQKALLQSMKVQEKEINQIIPKQNLWLLSQEEALLQFASSTVTLATMIEKISTLISLRKPPRLIVNLVPKTNLLVISVKCRKRSRIDYLEGLCINARPVYARCFTLVQEKRSPEKVRYYLIY